MAEPPAVDDIRQGGRLEHRLHPAAHGFDDPVEGGRVRDPVQDPEKAHGAPVPGVPPGNAQVRLVMRVQLTVIKHTGESQRSPAWSRVTGVDPRGALPRLAPPRGPS